MSEPIKMPGPWSKKVEEKRGRPRLEGAVKRQPDGSHSGFIDMDNPDTYLRKGSVNTGDAGRDEKIIENRKKLAAVGLEIHQVKMLDDEDPTKPDAIEAVQAKIAEINAEATMSEDWNTDEELALCRMQENMS